MSARDRWVTRAWAWCALLSGVGVLVALAWLLVAANMTLLLALVAPGVAAAAGWLAVTRPGWIRRAAVVVARRALGDRDRARLSAPR